MTRSAAPPAPAVIDLDEVLITPAVWRAWHARTQRAALMLRRTMPDTPSDDIPDEMGRVEVDGRLTIFVPLPDGSEIAMTVPPGAWARRQ
jgi:hypothetical protein